MLTIQETKDLKVIVALNAEVQNLHHQLHPELFKPHDPQALEAAMAGHLSDPNGHCFVVTLDGKPIGYALFFMREVPENAFHYTIRSIYIDQISVLPEYQNTGAGSLLMQQAESLARSMGITRIELDHWTSNRVAARFFRSKGYALCKERLVKVVGEGET